jgi:hypothetical protein
VRAVVFALVGSLLATIGHHAVDGGQVPWRFVAALAVAQLLAVRPLTGRRPGLLTVVGCTLAAQGAIHLALTTVAAGGHPGTAYLAGTGHSAHAGHSAQAADAAHAAHSAVAAGDGTAAWQHAAGAMPAAHAGAALVVAWLLQRADAAITTALAMGRTLRALVATALLRFPPRGTGATAYEPPAVPLTGSFEHLAAPARTRTLQHTLVRRGPPGRMPVPLVP